MNPLEHMYLVFLFCAYSAVWVLMFGFLYRMLTRAKRLEQEVRMLEGLWGNPGVTPSEARGEPGIQGPSV